MKKLVLAFVAVAAISFASCGENKGTQTTEAVDSVVVDSMEVVDSLVADSAVVAE
jgi:hypothetical protein